MTANDRVSSWCDALEQVLSQGELPGTTAHRRMSPVPRRHSPFGQSPSTRKGGVLILLFPGTEGVSFPVTLRSQRVVHHKGQISLPGGRQEAGDGSLAVTALRETQEEIGIAPSQVRLLGRLTPIYVPSSNSSVYPYVGYCPTAPAFSPDRREVSEIIVMPVSNLLDPSHRAEEQRQMSNGLVRIPYFQLGSHKIWGATAMILGEFAAILSDRPGLVPTQDQLVC